MKLNEYLAQLASVHTTLIGTLNGGVNTAGEACNQVASGELNLVVTPFVLGAVGVRTIMEVHEIVFDQVVIGMEAVAEEFDAAADWVDEQTSKTEIWSAKGEDSDEDNGE
jgi:hypothetical protein